MSRWRDHQKESLAASERYVAERARARTDRQARPEGPSTPISSPPGESPSRPLNILRRLLESAELDPEQRVIRFDQVTLTLSPEEFDSVERLQGRF